jgi:hypothetical protein
VSYDYLAQLRIVHIHHRDAEPEAWSSATATHTTLELSLPFKCHGDDGANLAGVILLRDKLNELIANPDWPPL